MSSYWIERTVPRKMESFCAVAWLQGLDAQRTSIRILGESGLFRALSKQTQCIQNDVYIPNRLGNRSRATVMGTMALDL